jgi:SAM-dependent methyltransferase
VTEEICRICGNTTANSSHRAREMMLGLRTEFTYLECSSCGCLQLTDPPEDLDKYYPSDYYSFQRSKPKVGLSARMKQALRRTRNKALLQGTPALREIVNEFLPYPAISELGMMRPQPNWRILDVGCGAGETLVDLYDAGFVGVLGVDRFVQQDIRCDNGVQIKKGFLQDLAGTSWDIIAFHHSFEHIDAQLETLALVRDLLPVGGRCLIRIPVAAEPWKKYGVNWVELDAPRHFYLHTEKSMRLLAAKAQLAVTDVIYDSSEFQFWGSELYLRDVPLAEVDETSLTRYFTNNQLEGFRKKSRELNREGHAGRAAFYLEKHLSDEK